MPILGAHMSIAGGYYKAAESGQLRGCQCIQLFTKNNNQWRAKPITPDEAEQFKQAVADAGLVHPLAHDSYLINLAAPDDELWQKSIDAFVHELERAALLGIPWVVTHPGAFTTGTEESGLQRVIAALDEVRQRTGRRAAGCLLENTAGQGSSLGARFEHLATIIDGVRDPSWLGVCIDTCHVFAAGYPLATPTRLPRDLKGHGRHLRAQADQGLSSQRQRQAAGLARGPARPHRRRADRASTPSATC